MGKLEKLHVNDEAPHGRVARKSRMPAFSALCLVAAAGLFLTQGLSREGRAGSLPSVSPSGDAPVEWVAESLKFKHDKAANDKVAAEYKKAGRSGYPGVEVLLLGKEQKSVGYGEVSKIEFAVGPSGSVVIPLKLVSLEPTKNQKGALLWFHEAKRNFAVSADALHLHNLSPGVYQMNIGLTGVGTNSSGNIKTEYKDVGLLANVKYSCQALNVGCVVAVGRPSKIGAAPEDGVAKNIVQSVISVPPSYLVVLGAFGFLMSTSLRRPVSRLMRVAGASEPIYAVAPKVKA